MIKAVTNSVSSIPIPTQSPLDSIVKSHPVICLIIVHTCFWKITIATYKSTLFIVRLITDFIFLKKNLFLPDYSSQYTLQIHKVQTKQTTF